MVRHIILWKLKAGISDVEKVKSEAKENLEALVGKIDGLVSLELHTSPLPSSNCDMMLESTLESAEALALYQSHPSHVAAANTYVRPFTETRLCLDFEEE